jgi:hypothetical protein
MGMQQGSSVDTSRQVSVMSHVAENGTDQRQNVDHHTMSCMLSLFTYLGKGPIFRTVSGQFKNTQIMGEAHVC